MALDPTYLPTTYAQAERMLNGRSTRKIGNNTWLERVGDDAVHVRYHATDVIRLHADGRITLHTGGHHTVSTKARLNYVARAHGYRIGQRQWTWYLTHVPSGHEVTFTDGVNIAQAPADVAVNA